MTTLILIVTGLLIWLGFWGIHALIDRRIDRNKDRLCKDCKYFDDMFCTHPINRDKVTGKLSDNMCSLERDYGYQCGPNGYLWEEN